MADIVVKDLGGLVRDLNQLISEFEGALDFQNAYKGDFADNWTGSRAKMVEAMKKFRDSVEGADQAWTEAERQMLDSLGEPK